MIPERAATLAVLLAIPLATATAAATAAQEPLEIDLSAIAATATVHNRTAEPLLDGGVRGLRLDARAGDGIAWIPDVRMGDGVIEVKVRGRNRPGQSFLGVAFRGVDETTYEAVYLRPFNFRSPDPQRRAHSVQYIAHPDYPWNRLREETPGTYESALEPAPEPEEWLSLKVVLDGPAVRVFVGEAASPALVVERIGDRGEGGIGLWVGNGSEGEFADLRIAPAGRTE